MSKKWITFGATVCAYASVEIDIPADLTEEQAIATVRDHYKKLDGNLVFTTDWSSREDDRIVCCSGDAQLDAMIGDMPIEPAKPGHKAVEVRHASCYGIEGTRNTHLISIVDLRQTSGQVLVDIGCIDGKPDDLLCLTAEVGTHPENGVVQLPCFHVNFDADDLALSIFKSGDALIVRMEEGVCLTPLRSEGCFILR